MQTNPPSTTVLARTAERTSRFWAPSSVTWRVKLVGTQHFRRCKRTCETFHPATPYSDCNGRVCVYITRQASSRGGPRRLQKSNDQIQHGAAWAAFVDRLRHGARFLVALQHKPSASAMRRHSSHESWPARPYRTSWTTQWPNCGHSRSATSLWDLNSVHERSDDGQYHRDFRW